MKYKAKGLFALLCLAIVLGGDFASFPAAVGYFDGRFDWLNLANAEDSAYPEIRNAWTQNGVFTVEVWNDLYGPSGEWILQCKSNNLDGTNLWIDIPPVISNTAVLPIVLSDTNAASSKVNFYRVLRRVETFP